MAFPRVQFSKIPANVLIRTKGLIVTRLSSLPLPAKFGFVEISPVRIFTRAKFWQDQISLLWMRKRERERERERETARGL